ncbi:16S rRNA (uracil(1498)-N(3))-methyltransferase [Pelagibaculum spongiae]|uniref:Ribosomal RNA small subunit methyltransferase E n=1 Tax=Pelagibaculum spongiae TaxID=2080658 RepID=A0A2V1H4N5_9GAMM|nr:16S rRNA (uracil(1498)-N(3))-methyltransferase [Pelagibaculum spongiae]PVZ72157.1 16S rRNA (uracil(1498)-N(3))-methyltransferase [Pelagibaculum spongiae]
MRISRFYTPQALTLNAEIQLDEAPSRHILKVLRLRAGAEVILFNGQGGEFRAELTNDQSKKASLKLVEWLDREVESPLKIHLAQVISKGDRMDFTIQKAVELGVNEITPLFSERCDVKLKGPRLEKKMEHWRGIITSACEQSGRNTPPTLLPAMTLQQWLEQRPQGTGLILDPHRGQSIKTLEPCDQVSLLVGPEGGLTDQEVDQAREKSMQGITLGPRILRTETAALSVISVLQSCFGDF